MVSVQIKDQENKLYLEYPYALRPPDDHGSLTYPPNYPREGVVFHEASLEAITQPFRSFNPEFLAYLNAAETLWTILTSPDLRSLSELTDVIARCHKLFANSPTTNLPPIYVK